MLKFNSSIVGGELPVGLVVVGIAIILPCGDLVALGLFVGGVAGQSGLTHPTFLLPAKYLERHNFPAAAVGATISGRGRLVAHTLTQTAPFLLDLTAASMNSMPTSPSSTVGK